MYGHTRIIALLSTLVLTFCFTTNVLAKNHHNERKLQDLPFISYVTFPSVDPVTPLTIGGQLRVPVPKDDTLMPAVLIVHGSAGVDSRGSFYAKALNRAGYATLEIDMWAARGWLGGITGRPAGVPQTLPDAFGALKFLSNQPLIDPDRIAIMGFSWGGVVSMLTATQPYTDMWGEGLHFAAHIAHYPVCWAYNRVPGYEFSEFTGAPVLIQAGELDGYDLPDTCLNLVGSLPAEAQANMEVKVYQHATHAWDRLQPKLTVFDPYACLGQGCEVDFIPNIGKAKQARRRVLEFFGSKL